MPKSTDSHENRGAFGKLLSRTNNNKFLVQMEDDRRIEAILTRKAAGCLFRFVPGLKVRVVFLPPPKTPKIIEVLWHEVASKEKRVTVVWEGEPIGYVTTPEQEMWFWYGQWHPMETEAIHRFHKTILEQGEAIVWVDGKKGFVFTEPSDEIEVKFYPQ